MQFIPVEEKDIPRKAIDKKKGPVLTPLLEFMELSAKSGKLVLDEGRSAKSVQSTLIYDAKKYHLPVKIIRRGDDIFVVREDL